MGDLCEEVRARRRAFGAGSGSWVGLSGGGWRGPICGSKVRVSESESEIVRVAWLMRTLWWI